MSAFSRDQEEYIKSLANIPLDKKCWCGWYPLGECPHCPPGATCEQKVAAMCVECRGAPHRPGDPLIHTIGCPSRLSDAPTDGGGR